MPQFYLSRYIGAGTKAAPFQPAVQAAGWSAIDLRPNPAVVTGFCLVSTPTAVGGTLPTGTINLGTGPALSAALRTQLGTALGVSVTQTTLAAAVAEILIDRAGGPRWKALAPARVGDRYRWEIHLGGLLWSQELPVIAGGASVSDDFDRANNTNLGANWTEDFRDWQIVSNAVGPVAPAADARLRYTGTPMDTNDHYVEASVTTVGGLFAGVTARHIGSSTATYYGVGVESTTSRQIFKSISGSITVLKNIAGTISFPGTVRGEVQGSTIRGLWNGVGFASATDTSITSGPNVGMFAYDPVTYYSWSAGDLAPLDYSGQPLLLLPQPLAEQQFAFTPYQPPITLRVWAVADAAAGVTLVVDDAAQAQAADAPVLTQTHVLAVDDATQAANADSPTLTQAHNLTVQDAAQAHAADEATLTQVHNLTVQDATQAQTVDSPALTQVHVLVVGDATHAQAADNLTLTQVHQLEVAEAAQAHSADQVALTQVHNLTVQDALQDQAADNVVLVVGGIDLVVQDATQAQAADNVTLTQVHSLAIDDALHGQAADGVTLTQVHGLTVQDAHQAQAADAVTLTQVHNLAIDDALHAQSVDSVTLAVTVTLTVQDAHQAQATDGVVLTQVHHLSVADALHVQTVDLVTLTQAHTLAVLDALQAHVADNVVLTTPAEYITLHAALSAPSITGQLSAPSITGQLSTPSLEGALI